METDGEDDPELQVLLAAMKDINNPEVQKKMKDSDMLYDTFVRKEDSEEKMRRLEEKYNLKTKAMERRIREMCNLSEAITEDAMKKGEIISIYKLVQKGRLRPAEAAEELNMSLGDFEEAMVKAGYKIPESV